MFDAISSTGNISQRSVHTVKNLLFLSTKSKYLILLNNPAYAVLICWVIHRNLLKSLLFIISSGKGRSIYDFLVSVSKIINLKNWEKYVTLEDILTNNNSEVQLIGKPNHINKTLNWKPKYSFKSLIKDMVKYAEWN